jgi:hypothetical protein
LARRWLIGEEMAYWGEEFSHWRGEVAHYMKGDGEMVAH